MTLFAATHAMKRRFTMLLLLVSFLGFASMAAADDRWAILRAINWVENPTNHTKMGRYGELGPYQFRPATWRMHTKRPFRQAIEREAADEVAIKHYEWIKRSLQAAGIDATPFNIAMAWNSGVSNVVNGRVPVVSYDYATRVTNLVQTFSRQAALAEHAAQQAGKTPAPVITMERPLVRFANLPETPRVTITLPPPAEVPVVRTIREPMQSVDTPMFTVNTTATLTPRISLLPKLFE